MRVLLASFATLLLACDSGPATREEAGTAVCECLAPSGTPRSEIEQCAAEVAAEFAQSMCPQPCLDCFAAADTCAELDEGCEQAGGESCFDCL